MDVKRKARQGKTRQGKARQERQGQARQDKAKKARQGKARQTVARRYITTGEELQSDYGERDRNTIATYPWLIT